MSDTTPDIDKYENADWWTVFRATQLCRELKQERDDARRERDKAQEELSDVKKALERVTLERNNAQREWKICETTLHLTGKQKTLAFDALRSAKHIISWALDEER